MKKIAIFTEGQGEQIFIRQLLIKVVGYSDLSFNCQMLYRHKLQDVPFEYPNQNAKFHFLIINAGTDERVLSLINERIDKLREAGYEKFIGIRDMYCSVYQKRSPRTIDEELSQKMIDSADNFIQGMNNPSQIVIYFSIMELEAWFLSMYNLFQKINQSLTLKYIEQKLGYNLRDIDPQKIFYKPSIEINNIFKLIDSGYTKKYSEMESICSRIDKADYKDAIANDRCKSFAILYSDISGLTEMLH